MEKPPSQELKKNPEVLNEWDKKVIEQGVMNIIGEMYRDFGNALPDGIILPDTSARPLLYTLDPILRRISEEKRIEMPKYYLINTRRPSAGLAVEEQLRPEFISEMETKGKSVDESQKKETIDSEEEMRTFLATFFDTTDEEDIQREIQYARPAQMKQARDTMKSRAKEIIAQEINRKGRTPKIAIVDDVATPQASTITEVRRAFDMGTIPAYVVVGFDEGIHIPNVKIGYEVDIDDRNTLNPKTQMAEFSYRDTDALGVKKEYDGTLSPRAVPIVRADVEKLTAEKKQLRLEMFRMGEKIARNVLQTLEA